MINKIKDFLKNKLGRKRSSELSDQDQDDVEDNFDDEDLDEAQDEDDELPPEPEEDSEEDYELPPEHDEMPPARPSLKEKLQERWNQLRTSGKESSRKLSLPKLGGLGAGVGTGAALSPGINKWNEKILSRSSRESIHHFFLVLLICVITYSIGKATALYLRGTPQVQPARSYTVDIPFDREFRPATLTQVRTINPFKTNVAGTTKKPTQDRCEEAQQPSTLPIRLVNTVVLQDEVKSLASVQVRGGRNLKEVRVGDQIDNLAKIFKIDRLQLLIRNLENGICEVIASDRLREKGPSPISVMSPAQSRSYIANKKLPGIENVGNKFTIQKSLLDEKLKDIGSILTQARAVKIQNPDGSMAFKLTEMDPEGLFPYLGLQDQDIITSINGKPIYDMNEVMSLFGRIKNLENLQLGIKREGQELKQEYSIKK